MRRMDGIAGRSSGGSRSRGRHRRPLQAGAASSNHCNHWPGLTAAAACARWMAKPGGRRAEGEGRKSTTTTAWGGTEQGQLEVVAAGCACASRHTCVRAQLRQPRSNKGAGESHIAPQKQPNHAQPNQPNGQQAQPVTSSFSLSALMARASSLWAASAALISRVWCAAVWRGQGSGRVRWRRGKRGHMPRCGVAAGGRRGTAACQWGEDTQKDRSIDAGAHLGMDGVPQPVAADEQARPRSGQRDLAHLGRRTDRAAVQAACEARPRGYRARPAQRSSLQQQSCGRRLGHSTASPRHTNLWLRSHCRPRLCIANGARHVEPARPHPAARWEKAVCGLTWHPRPSTAVPLQRTKSGCSVQPRRGLSGPLGCRT